jgi:hypothetical protein
MQGYTIWAWSPSLRQEQREFVLSDLRPLQDVKRAQQRADALAAQFNRDRKNRADDWVGRIKLETLGEWPKS